MIVPCLCYKRLSHDLSPSSEVLCVVDGKKSAQGTTGRGTPLPVVHNALTKTQAESLRRRECNRLVLRPEYSNFPASSLSERRRGMQLP